ncbi:CoA-binding protein [Candidatus Woesearchaeota archaeon]|nr:CoA-binding protein [Candidatus Woesearchaeota archaeon]
MIFSLNLSKARKILGIAKNTKVEDIKQKYRDLARKWHPDLNNGKESNKKMQEINKSYELVMKEEFGVTEPWNDYDEWWWKQYGNDPLWGNQTSKEHHGKPKRYPGIKKSGHYIGSSKSNFEKNKIKKFLDKKNTFAVIGVSKNPKKYGNKIYKELKLEGYKVYPVNPGVEKINADKCYPSLGELPNLPDAIDVVVPPNIAEKVVKEAVRLGIKNIWLQPGSESEEIIAYCKEHNISVLHNACIMMEKRKINKI